ncbi:MAG: radical SAM protein [Nitrospirae bacterium]|nr:MAG: radical SAM protein [Nitrospirota bacterium]
MKKKILFITPPFHVGVVEVAGSWVPLYMVYLAGAAEAAGYHAEIYDAMTKKVSHDDIARYIEASRPDFVATTSITCTSYDALKVLETAKRINPHTVTIIGGVHASFMYEEMLRNKAVDFVVRGEGEVTLVELLEALSNGDSPSKVKGIAYRENGQIALTEQRGFLESFDNLPMGWHLLDWEDYTYYILPGSRLGAICTSRGCSQECTFCSQQKFWHKTWRARSPEDIVREMAHLRKTYDVDVVLFTDDYPSPDRQRWERLLDLLIEADLDMKILMETRAEDIVRDRDILDKYKKAGIIHIYVGTEATNQESLDYIKKAISVEQSREALKLLRDVGIITETSMILGFPDETWDSIEQTLRLVLDYDPDFAHFLAIAPWPYSDIYDDLKDYIEIRDYRKYNLIDPVVKPKEMTLEDIDRAIVDCYRAFYMNKYAQMLEEKDEFKKNYMITAMKLMMANSFIKKKLGNLGGQMPEEVKRIINAAG